MGNLVGLSEFRFKTIRKYMAPIYTSLHQHVGLPLAEKEQFVRDLIPQFYKRMRCYQDLSLEKIVTSKISIETIAAFECGTVRVTDEIQIAYCKACSGNHEQIFFMHEIRAFYQPSIRESCRDVASDAFKRFGLMLPYVDYKNLNAAPGKVLEFKK